MTTSTRFWLAVGTPENWITAFDYGGIWGLKPSQERYWERMAENQDIVLFYVISPVSGVVGHGIVRTKLRQLSPLWPEERARNEVIWPLRFEFDVMSCLPPAAWPDQRVSSEELKVRVRSGFQEVEGSLAQGLVSALPASAPQDLVLAYPVGLRSRNLANVPAGLSGEPEDLHGHTQGLLVEIGRLQKYIADAEYPMENRRLDAVWRRVQKSVPSFVFEVHISGNLMEAIGKLKHCTELWNSNVFIVAQEGHRPAVNQLAAGTFHEIQSRLRFLELAQVQELYQRKRAYRELEHELGIFG